LNEIGQQLTCAVYGDCTGETVSESWALSDRRELPVWSRGYSILIARVRTISPSLGGASRRNGCCRAECAPASTLPVSDDAVGVTGQAGSPRCVEVVCGVGGGGARGGAPRSSPTSKSLGKTLHALSWHAMSTSAFRSTHGPSSRKPVWNHVKKHRSSAATCRRRRRSSSHPHGSGVAAVSVSSHFDQDGMGSIPAMKLACLS
jgi:hypothetical protein